MVIAYHVIFGAYGFWLPNDPRGSWSTEVWADHLQPFGEATKVNTRKSLADRKHDQQHRLEAKRQLQYPSVSFNRAQIDTIGFAFGEAIAHLKLDVHACAVMPDHVHLAIGRTDCTAEYLAGFLKRAATRRFLAENMHPLDKYRQANGRIPSPWVVGGWFVYLNTPEEIIRCIRYVDNNPVKARMPAQQWEFVREYSPKAHSPRGRGG